MISNFFKKGILLGFILIICSSCGGWSSRYPLTKKFLEQSELTEYSKNHVLPTKNDYPDADAGLSI